MKRTERALLILGLSGWILLGLAHTLIVMAGPRGWRPDRSAPGAAAVVGIPGDTDPRTVGSVRELLRESGPGAATRLSLVLPAATDSSDLLYTRYQLAHLLYPVRVRVGRGADPISPPDHPDSTLIVIAPGVAEPEGCRVAAEVDGHRLVDCGDS